MIIFLLPIYIFFSLLAVAFTVYDKIAASKRLFRIPEKVLFLISLCGGSGAMYITMLVIRHKTKHKRFMVGLPLMALAQAALLAIIP